MHLKRMKTHASINEMAEFISEVYQIDTYTPVVSLQH